MTVVGSCVNSRLRCLQNKRSPVAARPDVWALVDLSFEALSMKSDGRTGAARGVQYQHPGGSGSVRPKLWLGAGLAGALVLTMSACASSDRGSESSATGASSAPAASGSASGDASARVARPIRTARSSSARPARPSMFDPLYATDGETFRVARQMNEGLITFKPGTADVEPALRRILGAVRGRHDLDLQAARGRDVPRRHPVRRRGRLLQLRPDVQPDRRRRDPGRSTGRTPWAGSRTRRARPAQPMPSVYESCTAAGRRAPRSSS